MTLPESSECGIEVPSEMRANGVTMFDELQTSEGVEIAKKFIELFNEEPLWKGSDPWIDGFDDVFGEDDSRKVGYAQSYSERIKNAKGRREFCQLIDSIVGPKSNSKRIDESQIYLIADLIRLSSIVGIKARHEILNLMPAYAKTDEKTQEDFGAVSQSNIEPAEIYKKFDFAASPENSILEHVIEDINFQDWMSGWTRLYRSNAYKFEACNIAVTTNEMARRFLDDPARLIDTYYQAAKEIEESNEIQARQLIEWYLPKKAEEEDLMQADAARMADMVLSRAMLSPGRESREDGHGDDSTPSPSP